MGRRGDVGRGCAGSVGCAGGDVAARRGIEASVKALDDWFAYLGPNGNKGCAFAVQDTVVSSDRDMASVFAVLTCQPNPPATTKQETIRQLFGKRCPQATAIHGMSWPTAFAG